MGRRQYSAQRLLIAQEAARIISEQGISDFRMAKQKAAERYGLGEHHHHLPGNEEIEAALRDRQRLFGGERHAGHLRRLRAAAVRAMQLLARFEPRLVGPVLSGVATEHSDVQLHLFAERAESVELFLAERGIRSEIGERRYRLRGEDYRQHPLYRFALGDIGIEAAVFAPDGLRQAPASPVDGQPMRRAGVTEVEALLAESG